MRKILVPFALSGLLALPMVACDVESLDGEDTSGNTDTGGGNTDTGSGNTDTGGGNTDTTTPTEYFAVLVDDSAFFSTHRADGGNPCATSSVGAHGADIDAVGLFDGSTVLGYFATVDVQTGSQCEVADKYKADAEATGAPNGTLTENFVSLGGGALIGEFENQVQVLPGYTLVVYEVGKDVGGIDEKYDVFVATELDCINQDRASCTVKVTGTDGAAGEGTFPLSGF